MNKVTVSICVVARNEERVLPALLEDFCAQTYPHELTEIVLVDSMSTDGTRKLMEDFAASDHGFYSVVVASNPGTVQASGWNVVLENANSDVIVRIDAHAHVPEDFLTLKMKALAGGEDVCGGSIFYDSENKGAWSETLLDVENSLFGSSINRRKGETKEKTYVSTVFHAGYRREVFAKVGGFNENLLRSEDNEMHYRLRKAGYKLCRDTETVSYQHARTSLKRMIKQKYGNGKWMGLTLGVCPGCVSVYHLVPFAFLMAIILTSVLIPFGIWHLSAAMWAMYGIFAIGNTIISCVNNGFRLPKLLMPLLFLTFHLSYGIGTLVGIIQMPFRRKKLKKCDNVERIKFVVQEKIEKSKNAAKEVAEEV